ncbi:hypothetical protein, partial [Nocardia pseudovaccinii]|uniref:hypothetical protein n=1 Tax=Nocardia pseudovaccinii TaxID=189540 RepID=UPI001C3FE3C4
MQEQEKKARVAAAHEHATRRSLGDKMRELSGADSPADRVAAEAERAAHTQAELAGSQLAQAHAVHEAAVAEHDAALAAVAGEPDSRRPDATDGPRPRPADTDPANESTPTNDSEAQPALDAPAPDEAPTARQQPADADANDGPRPQSTDTDANSEQPQPVPTAAPPAAPRRTDSTATPVDPRPSDSAAAHSADGRAARSRPGTPSGSPQRGEDHRVSAAAAGTPRQGGRRTVVTAATDTAPPDLAVASPHAPQTDPSLVHATAPTEAEAVALRPSERALAHTRPRGDSAESRDGAGVGESGKTVGEPGDTGTVKDGTVGDSGSGEAAAGRGPRTTARVGSEAGDEQAATGAGHGEDARGTTEHGTGADELETSTTERGTGADELGTGAGERGAEARQRLTEQHREALREDQRRRVAEAAQRERAAGEALREKQNRVRVAAAHERATRRSLGERMRGLFAGDSSADRVAAEAEHAAHTQTELARAELAQAKAVYDTAVGEHDAVLTAVAGELVGELRTEFAELPRADPQTKQDLTQAQGHQYTATSKKMAALYEARRHELAGESWAQRRQVMESGDEVEALLRCIDAMGEGTGKTPRWNQIKAFLTAEHGYMRQMGTGQGKTIVGGVESLWQLSRGEPVQLPDGREVRVHHVITTTEVLANEGFRQFSAMLHKLGYETSRWDPHNPPADPQHPTVYYMTYDEVATAHLFDRPPPGDTATIDEADAVLIHDETVHYQSDGQREPATDTEAAGVYRVRDFLRGVLAERELTSTDLRARPQQSLATASRLWQQATGRAFTTEETEMARAFLDVKAGRLKLNRDFQKFDDKIQILDANGKPRSDPKIGTDSRWFGGRHKMVEAMFGAQVYTDGTGSKQVTVETVLGGYKRLNLMSGTLERTATEIKDNFPVQGGLAKIENFGKSNLKPLDGLDEQIYLTTPEMLKHAVTQVQQLQDHGRPVLVIGPNDLALKFSLLLNKNGIEHTAITGKWFAQHRDNNA